MVIHFLTRDQLAFTPGSRPVADKHALILSTINRMKHNKTKPAFPLLPLSTSPSCHCLISPFPLKQNPLKTCPHLPSPLLHSGLPAPPTRHLPPQLSGLRSTARGQSLAWLHSTSQQHVTHAITSHFKWFLFWNPTPPHSPGFPSQFIGNSSPLLQTASHPRTPYHPMRAQPLVLCYPSLTPTPERNPHLPYGDDTDPAQPAPPAPDCIFSHQLHSCTRMHTV